MPTCKTPENFEASDEAGDDVVDVITQLQAVVPQGNRSTINRSGSICHVTREELNNVLSDMEGYVAYCRDNIVKDF